MFVKKVRKYQAQNSLKLTLYTVRNAKIITIPLKSLQFLRYLYQKHHFEKGRNY